MRVLVVGARGMLGQDVVLALAAHDVTALGSAELDIRDPVAVAAAVRDHDAVVNAAAYSDVDGAETDEAAAFAVNADGPGHLARAAADARAAFVHVSTDYVFPGDATEPYAEDTPLAPVNVYGRSKAEGERRVLAIGDDSAYILRTAWLYGRGGANFPRTMLRLGRERDTVSVVTDQVGQPTWSADVAERIVRVLEERPPAGVYHATNSGRATWFEFARAVFALGGLDPDHVLPTDSSAFVRPAARPAFSVLGHDRWAQAGMAPLRPWHDALTAAHRAGALEGF